MQSKQDIIHPGLYIKRNVLPKELTVKEAAKLLGVGRPALSNLLNGNAALSPEMALRLEKTFGVSGQQILKMQAEFDEFNVQGRVTEIPIQKYVPQILRIKASQIESWASGNTRARYVLAVLLRKLVHSTGKDLVEVDFPGYENSERKGPDGILESNTQTPWIPIGKSLWEFGCNKRPGTKAEKDFNARVKSIKESERRELTFVFVTPMNWDGKNTWKKSKEAMKQWRAVKVYDASDIEQWLEQSLVAQLWLAEQIGLALQEIQTLESYWDNWSNVTTPALVKSLFDPAVQAHASNIVDWLKKTPNEPLVVAADSKQEGLAFLACVFASEKMPADARDLPILFKSSTILGRLSSSMAIPFVLVLSDEDIEKEIGGTFKNKHIIIVRSRNAVLSQPQIVIDYLSHDAFEKALIEMGFEKGTIDLLGRQTAYSPGILRRRLSKLDAIRTPNWTRDLDIVRNIIPMMLIGCWHSKSKGDREIIGLLTKKEYHETEKICLEILRLEDSPLWSADHVFGVVSKADVLFSIFKSVTEKELEDFFLVAEIILSENDPALDLPEENRWLANLYGKTRDHSGVLRRGVCDTLIFLAVHGNNLFQNVIHIDLQSRINNLIRSLLSPLTIEKLLSHNKDLPSYAEASPNEFLSIVEEDLRTQNPVTLELMKPVRTDLLGRCDRSEILWSLEGLAWKPEQLMRVCNILSRLSEREIKDNYMNKPENSLFSIFRSWMPQTSASFEQRVSAIENIVKRFPKIGWKICIEQLEPGHRMGNYNHRPKWRTDAVGHGQPFSTTKESHDFQRKCFELALSFKPQNAGSLTDLVKILRILSSEYQSKVWELIDEWIDSGQSDEEKATLRENIRVHAFSVHRQNKSFSDVTKKLAEKVFDKLLPSDVVVREQWLFKTHWVHESTRELEDVKYDFKKRDERIDALRKNSMSTLWSTAGLEGVFRMISVSEAPDVIGWYLAQVLPALNWGELITKSINIEQNEIAWGKIDSFLRGFFGKLTQDERETHFENVRSNLQQIQIVRLLNCFPFNSQTWTFLRRFSSDISDAYWQDALPAALAGQSIGDFNEMIDSLLRVNRPAAAFNAIHLITEKLDSGRLSNLLRKLGTTNEKTAYNYGFSAWDISRAFKILNERKELSEEEMANLEFLYINILDDGEYELPNLQRHVMKSPLLFVELLAHMYKRTDNGKDPAEWELPAEAHQKIFRAIFTLFRNIQYIPGTRSNDEIDAVDLLSWIRQTRELCAKYARAAIGDETIGQILATSPIGKDGVWPCEPVRDVLEETASRDLGVGVLMGVHNSRGAHMRGPGGDQERELSVKYKNWARQLAFTHPYVSNVLSEISASYDRDAKWHDSKDSLSKTLNRIN